MNLIEASRSFKMKGNDTFIYDICGKSQFCPECGDKLGANDIR